MIKDTYVEKSIKDRLYCTSLRILTIIIWFRIKDGYEYVLKCENTRSWPNSLNWYTTIIEVLENYQVRHIYLLYMLNPIVDKCPW